MKDKTNVQIRNFSIIAHIDHGKSTLADRLIQKAGLISKREFRDQILDNMDIERERGITIKSQTVSLPYQGPDGQQYQLNLIDTPGHVDFSYEVSRALASCEGVLLLVDASQGVEAQTMANFYSALEQDLVIVPVINKIDLPSADIDKVRQQLEVDLGLDGEEAILCSAKKGIGIDDVLKAVVEKIPSPKGSNQSPLEALIFDATYDPFRGAVISCRVFNGALKPGQMIRMISTEAEYKVEEVGSFRLHRQKEKQLICGQVGYIIAGIKEIQKARMGDTITLAANPAPAPLSGFKSSQPVVFSSIYPIVSEEYKVLADALEKYKLNDAALVSQKDSSAALGQGFRCGFLGLLHLEIVQERLKREFDRSLIMTLPSVRYQFLLKGKDTPIKVDNPLHYPEVVQIEQSLEPFVKAKIITPEEFMGPVMKLCLDRRGENIRYFYSTRGRMEINVELPLAEIIYEYYDRLKSVSRGYASFDYDFYDYRAADLVKVDILINGEKVDALSLITHKQWARKKALFICEKLRQEIPRQMFKVAVQGAIGGQIIARTNIAPLRKDVTAKLYGGDVTRKRKLLEKQKKGKKKMRSIGRVLVPQKAFVAVLKGEGHD